MGIFTTWLLATEPDAPAVASIVVTEERSYDEWPSVSLHGIGDMEFQDLGAIVHADGAGESSTLGDLLYQGSDEGPFVAAVAPAFIGGLAALSDTSLPNIAAAWRRSEHLREWRAEDVLRTLTEIVAFARRSRQAQTPVLQLVTI